MKKISFVIPCYNSEHTIEQVVNEIKEVVETNAEYSYEIILVNDASPDNVSQVIERLSCEDNNIIDVELAKNFGQHAATMAGYSLCTGEIVVSMDDDGQSPANEIFTLINQLENGYDVVFAEYASADKKLFRRFGTWMNNKMLESLLSKPKSVTISSFVALKKYIIDEIVKYNNPYPYIAGLIFRTTNNISCVKLSQRHRLQGRSNYSFRKLISLWMNGFTAFSIKPLRLATLTGFITAILGFIYLIYTIIKKLFIYPEMPTGYSSTMAILLFIGGMIMMTLGLLGEYIGRIYISINDSPQYIIKKKK